MTEHTSLIYIYNFDDNSSNRDQTTQGNRFAMRLHEFEGADIFEKSGIPVPKRGVATSTEEALKIRDTHQTDPLPAETVAEIERIAAQADEALAKIEFIA